MKLKTIKEFSTVGEGTVVRRSDLAFNPAKYMVSQVRAGKYMLISQHGNRFQDVTKTLYQLPSYLKSEGFVILNHGGLK